MPKKGSSKKNIKNDIKNDDSTSSDENNENDKTTRFLTNQILKQQKINYKNSVNKFLKNNGLIILSF
jgi:hypothetical protein